jgi:hypothetical protein
MRCAFGIGVAILPWHATLLESECQRKAAQPVCEKIELGIRVRCLVCRYHSCRVRFAGRDSGGTSTNPLVASKTWQPSSTT